MITRDEDLSAALQLPERDRLEIAGRLLETVPDDLETWWAEDEEFLDELDRRAGDPSRAIPAEEIWQYRDDQE